MGVTESHREPERDRERASKSLREPQREPIRAKGNQSLTMFYKKQNIALTMPLTMLIAHH